MRISKIACWGSGAAFLAAFVDLVRDSNNGVVLRIAGTIEKVFIPRIAENYANIIAIISLTVIGYLTVSADNVSNSRDAFARGLAVLAFFGVAVPPADLGESNQIGKVEDHNSREGMEIIGLGGALWRLDFASLAYAQNIQKSAEIGKIYVGLSHLRGVDPVPQSTVEIVKEGTSNRVSIFKVSNRRFAERLPYGAYTVRVQTPGYKNISFSTNVDRENVDVELDAKESNTPIFFQKLIGYDDVEPVELSFYVIATSSKDKNEALKKASILKKHGYASNVYETTTEYYAVTIGHLPRTEANELLKIAVNEDKADADAYLHDGTGFLKEIP